MITWEYPSNPGQTYYYAVLTQDLSIANASTGALLARNATNWPNAKIPLVDSGGGYYTALEPTGLGAGSYGMTIRQQIGSGPLRSDPQVGQAPGTSYWSGASWSPTVMTPVGSVAVNHNTGGTDNLTVRNNLGAPIAGATVRAYLKSDYSANPLVATLLGWTATDSFGHWIQPIFLAPGNAYAIVASAPGEMTQEIDVSI